MRKSGVTTLDVKQKQQNLRLVLPPLVSSSQELIGSSNASGYTVKSPVFGEFLRRGIDDGLPSLEPGMCVVTGEVLGYVCIGAVRVIVNAPVCGVITDQGPQDATALRLGDTVFKLETTS